jgi:adenylate kinase family enzyme
MERRRTLKPQAAAVRTTGTMNESGRSMRRIMVMGPPGAGKSTLSRQLGAQFGLPVFHLDQVWWRPGWIEAPPDEFRADVERIAALPEWVIDGNFTITIECRLRAADTLIYLDCPTWLSLLRVIRRTIRGYGRIRPDMAAGCPEQTDLKFLRFVWSYNRNRRARNLALVESFAGQKIILTARDDVERLIDIWINHPCTPAPERMTPR